MGNHDGVITRDEFNSYARRQASANADVAEKGMVSFAAASRPPSQLESHLQRLQRHTEELRSDLARNAVGDAALPPLDPVNAVFDALDRNHDGVISRAEWNQAAKVSPLGRTAEFGI